MIDPMSYFLSSSVVVSTIYHSMFIIICLIYWRFNFSFFFIEYLTFLLSPLALATLYGFILATEGKFDVVNIVSYASPYVGTQSFRKAFRELEGDGKLRHVRVSNTSDSIRKSKSTTNYLKNEDVEPNVFVWLVLTLLSKPQLSTHASGDSLMLV